jgi:hypothetical protein
MTLCDGLCKLHKLLVIVLMALVKLFEARTLTVVETFPLPTLRNYRQGYLTLNVTLGKLSHVAALQASMFVQNVAELRVKFR